MVACWLVWHVRQALVEHIPAVCPDVVVGMSREWDNLESVLKEAGDLAPVGSGSRLVA
jgi:hypothetical protein